MKGKKRIIVYRVLTILMAMSFVSCANIVSRDQSAFTPPITDVGGNTIPGSISSLEKVVLNGVEQWILVRGKDTAKPVILFLHGGPGGANMVFRELFITEELEENFVVVLWDQRGAGKSYSPDLTEDNMRVDEFIKDTIALTNHLCARFKQDKIFLLGHSWGSGLGFITMIEHPDYPQLYHAFIAAGEAADWDRRQTMSYEWTLEQAREKGHGQAITALEKLQPFDPTDLSHIAAKNEWLAQFGGEFHSAEMFQEYIDYLGKGPEYSQDDVQKWMQGNAWAAETTSPEIAKAGYNVFRDLPEVKIPLYFFVGRYDYQTPGPLAEEYYKFVKAPKKDLIWFEESAHYMIFAEPNKMTQELIRIAHETLNEP